MYFCVSLSDYFPLDGLNKQNNSIVPAMIESLRLFWPKIKIDLGRTLYEYLRITD